METDSRKNSNTESKWYCPHYERETCLIHFQCCPEGKLYPCHKCHNEANVVIENPSVKDQENEKALDSSERNTVENTGTSVELAAEGSAADWNNEGDQEENQADVEQQELCESPSNVVETDTNTDTSVEITTEGSAAEWNNGGDRQENLADVEEQELCESSSNVVENTDTSAELTTGSSAPEWNNEADQQDNSEPSGNRDAAIKNSDCKDVKDPKPPPRSVHLEATAFDCTYLRCRECGHQQEFSEKCEYCGKVFAKYFCHKCKLLIEKDVDAYHCDKCGICRGNKSDNFHCDECNVCLSTSLKGNHKCFTNRGHDPCAICFEEVFSGAVVLPCFHMIHGECGVRLLQFGSQKCPVCRRDIFPPANKEVVIVEDASGQNTPSSLPSLKQLLCKVPNFLTKLWERRHTQPANTQQQRSVEMINLPG